VPQSGRGQPTTSLSSLHGDPQRVSAASSVLLATCDVIFQRDRQPPICNGRAPLGPLVQHSNASLRVERNCLTAKCILFENDDVSVARLLV
jgi:hypothetical protein